MKERKQKDCMEINSQKNSEETMTASVHYTDMAKAKLNTLSGFLLKQCHNT